MVDNKRAKITIDDVAEKAKVSKTTISRYINGKYEYMSETTRETIQKVIEELGYRPSNIARSLKSQKSGAVGCVIADITSPFSSYIVKGINDVCKKNGYQVLFVNTDNNQQSEIESIQSLMDNKLDGLIVNATGYNDEYLMEIQEEGMPIVMADRCLKNKYLMDSVTTQNYTSTYECIKFLQKQGYTKVAFFTQELGEISSRYERHNAYIDAMAKLYSLDGNRYTYLVDTDDLSVCTKGLRKLKEENPEDEIGIFTVNGVTLMDVLTAMNKEGFAIGKDFGICGFDDWGWASLIPPGITTITQDSYATGVMAAQLLIKRIEKGISKKKKFIELPTQLVVRGSTTPYPRENNE
ncbi:LacI family transcriptional regulator [Mobilisporobacter senegalensis]|uniref:LacI family transcriptional regulator n=1 Tax=Mobilisporobacter senegalensis TaxID=1329262 RepID=A0A3N1XNJ5_9FIRM|nr:LacI family DNA-binding transcriptional regulator [Mobilisporobacter senegalensis]ROR28263.1 LacI family transcriptional regulator [Mobilisporobacter senegalensis]